MPDVPASMWAILHPELLTQIFALLRLDSSLACERTCSVWRRVHSTTIAFASRDTSLIFMAVAGRTQVQGSIEAPIVMLNISKHAGSLAMWLSIRCAAFDAIWFGTSQHPVHLSKQTWQTLLSTFTPDTQKPQLKLAVPGNELQPSSFFYKSCKFSCMLPACVHG